METRERLAELAVLIGANVQPGQVVRISADVEHSGLVCSVADAAYRHGAKFVEVDLGDARVQRSQILHATGDLQAHVPAWEEAGIRELDAIGGARIMIHGPGTSGLFDDLDPVRVSQSQPPRSQAWRDVEYRVNSTMIPGPTNAWACALHPDLSAVEALAKLWGQIEVACRLDLPDPVASWRKRFAELRRTAAALSALRLDAIRLCGPGTELVVGLCRRGDGSLRRTSMSAASSTRGIFPQKRSTPSRTLIESMGTFDSRGQLSSPDTSSLTSRLPSAPAKSSK